MKRGTGEYFSALITRIDALSLRERVMVLAAALVLIAFIGDAVLLAPQRLHLAQLTREGAREHADLAALDTQRAELERSLAADPDDALRRRLAQANAVPGRPDDSFQLLGRSIVPPEQMTRLLTGLLRQSPGIRIVQVKTLAPQPLRAPDPPAAIQPDGQSPAAAQSGAPSASGPASASRTGPADIPAPVFWRHGLELTLRGSNDALVRYLETLERAPMRVHFGSIVMDATGPEIELRLTVHTLGLERTWLAL